MPECYADTLLIETLVPTVRGYNHKHSCFKVESGMKSLDGFALGIIDNDKNQIGYLKEFEIIDEIVGSLLLLKHRQKHQYIIQICPALERWILNVCEHENIDLTIFGLVNDLEDLKGYTKRLVSLKNEKLRSLFTQIGSKDKNVSVRKLKVWVKHLKEYNYNADINELKNG